MTDDLSTLYTIRDVSEVWRYLAYHPGAVRLLRQIPARVREYFPEAPLALEYHQGPGADEEDLRVAIIVPMPDDAALQDAMKRLTKLGDDWWLDIWAHTDSGICIDIEAAEEIDDDARR